MNTTEYWEHFFNGILSLLKFCFEHLPSMSDIGTLLSGIGTFILAIVAIFGYRTAISWKDERKYEREVDTLNKTYELAFELKNFLDDITDIKINASKYKQYIDDTNSKIYLLIRELRIIKNKQISEKMQYLFENVKSRRMVGDKIKNGQNEIFTVQSIVFLEQYKNNVDGFKNKINDELEAIKKLCDENLTKIIEA
jgi:hypothetical protein